MKILLCNLVHTGMKKTSEAMPLGIGYVASYLNMSMSGRGITIETKLLMQPSSFARTVKKYNPSIIGFSNYLWNTRLSRHYAAVCKSISPRAVVVFGGPDFPANDADRKKYMDNSKMIDFYVVGEGEVGMANIADRYLECGGDLAAMKKNPIEGALFNNSAGDLVKPKKTHLLPALDSYPSPVLNGYMDEFLTNGFTPMIQFVRGCPYQCAYCNEGINIPGSIRSYPVNRVLEEIVYLEKMHKKFKGAKHIIIADANFGVNKDDHKICRLFQDTRKRSGWPTNMEVSTGKSNKERLIKNIAMIRDSVEVTLALQSMNEPTLKSIKRRNFSADELVEITNRIFDKRMRTGCELIIPLPEETLDSYLKALKYCLDLGMKVHTHTLVMLMETPIAQAETIEKYGMKTMYRVLYRCFGNYDNKPVIETEKVCVATKDYSFEDYVATRVIGCINGIFILNEMFAEMRAYILQEGMSIFEWMMKCYQRIEKGKSRLSDIVTSFKKECVEELREDEEDLFDHYGKPENFKGLLEGKKGRNLITTYQGIVINQCYDEAVEIAKISLLEMVNSIDKNRDIRQSQVGEIAKYLMLQNFNCFNISSSGKESYKFSWDIPRWIEDGFAKPLAFYKSEAELVFSYEEGAKEQLKWYIDEYGDHPEGYGRILARVDPQLLKKKIAYKHS